MRRTLRTPAQRGVALIVALILLLVTSIVALSAVRFSSVELRTSTNEELRLEAFQAAESTSQAVADVGLSVFGTPPYTVCTNTAGNPISGCNATSLTLPGGLYAAEIAAGQVAAAVTLVAEGLAAPPIFGKECSAAAGTGCAASQFRVTGWIDRSAAGYGRSQVNEGYIFVYPGGGGVVYE